MNEALILLIMMLLLFGLFIVVKEFEREYGMKPSQVLGQCHSCETKRVGE